MTDHGRSKYKRTVHCLESSYTAIVDVYSVLEAFNVTCPARAHAVKKLLCAGIRGKCGTLQDLEETKVALERAIVLEKERLKKDEQKDNHQIEPSSTHEEVHSNPGIGITSSEVISTAKDPTSDAPKGWRVFAVFADWDENRIHPIGYRVGWPVKTGGAFMVGHYLSGDGLSLSWCQNAAESDAKRKNEAGKRPEDYLAFLYCGIKSEDLI